MIIPKMNLVDSIPLQEPRSPAFTRVDLLVVLGVMAILLPLMASNHPAARSSICLNNMRQLAMAMNLYTADHTGFLPPNPDDGNTVAGHNWFAGTMTNPMQATNQSYLHQARYNLLAKYLPDYRVFRCPADSSMVNGLPRVRSCSLNHAVGCICAEFDETGNSHSGLPTLSVNGPWLDGYHGHHRGKPYRTYGRSSDFLKPSSTYLILDEDEKSLNDGNFVFSMAIPKWVDWPATYHDLGAGFAFADGHSEIHHWVVASTKVPSSGPSQVATPDGRDWKWLAERTTQLDLAK